MLVAVGLMGSACTSSVKPGTDGATGPGGAHGSSDSSPSSAPSPSPTGPPTASYPDFWRVPHDGDPVDPNSSSMMRAIERSTDHPYVLLSGTSGPRWGAPYYEAEAGGSQVTVTCPADPCFDFPASGTVRFRIPDAARPSQDPDRELVVIDRNPDTNAVLWLWRACPPASCGRWTAHGMSFTSFDSNEVDRCWVRQYPNVVPWSNLANVGHRGLPGAYLGIRYDEVATDRSIPHVLKLAIPDTGGSHVYPYVGDESRGGSIPEGTLVRLKASVDISGLSPAAQVIARALQTYGAVVGDTSGGPVELKVENLFVEGSRVRWSSLGIGPSSLSKIALRDFEVVRAGYGAPGPPPAACPTG